MYRFTYCSKISNYVNQYIIGIIQILFLGSKYWFKEIKISDIFISYRMGGHPSYN